MDRRHQSWRWPWVLVGTLAGLAMLAGLGWTVWKLPLLLYGDVAKASPDARLQAASSFRTAIVAGLAGLAALASLFFANRTYRLTQQGQLTERYTKAIEHLGTDKLDVCLGGIYALERIAVDSKRDHPTVVEVLSAFVREHGQPATQPNPGTADDASREPNTPGPTTDVQAAVTVLGRLPRRRDVSRGDLRDAHLEGADMVGAHLEKANLNGAQLKGADLERANLEKAELQKANLQGASLIYAHLKGAYLIDTHLEGAVLFGAHLEEANLYGTHMEGAHLIGTHGLTKRQLEGVILDERTELPPGLRRPTSATPPQPAGEQP